MSKNEFGLDWDSRVSETNDNRTREQTIVWRDDFVEIFEQLEWYLASYDSKQAIASLEEGGFVIGTFRSYEKDFSEMFFMSQEGYNYRLSRIKEFAFLE